MRHMWMRTLAISSVLLLGAGPAGALTLDFDDFVHGEAVAQQLQIMLGVQLTTLNVPRGHDLGIAFDTNVASSETTDDDLLFSGGWAGGNLAGEPVHDPMLNRILIIQEDASRCGPSGDTYICDDPDDEGGRPAGWFRFDLPDAYDHFAFDLVDVEDAMTEKGMVVFTYEGGDERVYAFEDFAGVAWGNRTANHIDLGDVGMYDRVVIHIGGSGGVDNLVMTPEPGTIALLGLGLAGLSIASRRRA
jgi:hypothetical protein